MKKNLLLGAFLLGSLLTVKAQEMYSFEAAEGYTAGQLHEQNEWMVSTTEGGAPVAGFNITDADASDGTFSLGIAKDPAIGNLDAVGILAFSPAVNTAEYTEVEISFDFIINVTDANTASNFAFLAQSNEQGALTSRIEFAFDGTVLVVDEGAEGIGFIDTEATWTAETWHNVRINYSFLTGKINYFLDDALIHEGTTWAGTLVDQVVIGHDNWPGSTAMFDNITVAEGTLGVNEQLASQFSIFPNPANNVINIANAENILVNGVTITDLNGRTVKTVNYNGVSEAQINISDLASGMYMMTVASDKGTMTKKIVKN